MQTYSFFVIVKKVFKKEEKNRLQQALHWFKPPVVPSLPPSNPSSIQVFPKKQKLQQLQSKAAHARHKAEPPQVPLRTTLAGTMGFSKSGRVALWGSRKTWHNGKLNFVLPSYFSLDL